MTAKKWTAAFFITAAVFALLILALNVLVDPFGVFGDPIFHWDSYSETQNPRIGKIAYLDREHTGRICRTCAIWFTISRITTRSKTSS